MESGRGGIGSRKHDFDPPRLPRFARRPSGISGHSHKPARTKQAIARIVNQLYQRPDRPSEMRESMDELLGRPTTHCARSSGASSLRSSSPTAKRRKRRKR